MVLLVLVEVQVRCQIWPSLSLYPRIADVCICRFEAVHINSISSDRLTIRDVTFHRNDIALSSSWKIAEFVLASSRALPSSSIFYLCRLSFVVIFGSHRPSTAIWSLNNLVIVAHPVHKFFNTVINPLAPLWTSYRGFRLSHHSRFRIRTRVHLLYTDLLKIPNQSPRPHGVGSVFIRPAFNSFKYAVWAFGERVNKLIASSTYCSTTRSERRCLIWIIGLPWLPLSPPIYGLFTTLTIKSTAKANAVITAVITPAPILASLLDE